MAFRALILVLGLLSVFLCYNIYSLTHARAALRVIPAAYGFGPENADLRVVEFFEYNCAHCRKISPIVMEAVKKDGKALYIPLPLAREGLESYRATQLVYAAAQQEKYRAMHLEMISNFRVITDAILAGLGEKTGIDVKKIETDSESESVTKMMNQGIRVFRAFGGDAVPMFIIGNEIIYKPGEDEQPTVEDFLRIFAQARARQ